MASPLLLSSSILATPLSTHRPNLFKVPPLPPHSSTRPTLSCAAGGNRKDNPQFDRRDMLLGMGGLYGTTSLAPAMAEPIPPPALDKCTTAKDIFSDKTYTCCPPTGTPAKNYVLPKMTTPRIRPALHMASDRYFAQFERAIQAMKDLSVKDPNDPRGFDQQSHVHCAYCNLAYPQSPGSDLKLQIHFCWHFFPWHRWYLYFYERICAKLIGDETFALPFWNWDNPPGMVMPDIFTNESSPLYNAKRDITHYPPEVTDLRYNGEPNTNPPDKIIANNLTEMYTEIVPTLDCKDPYDFYGGKYVVGTPPGTLDSGAGTIERGSHTAMHRWVGQNTGDGYDMGNFATAGNDLLFFCTHVNIDRLWNVWRQLRDKRGKPKDFNDPDWLDAKYLFYDENAKPVIVSVRDSLDNEKMGFTWQQVDNPWLPSKPKARVKRSSSASKSSAPKAADVVFPFKLNKVLRVVVDRREEKERKKKDEAEVLVIALEADATKFVRFEVFINDDDVNPDELIATAEYAGCYSQVPLTKPGNIKTRATFNLTELLKELDNEDDDKILVSVVPRRGGEFVSIGGIKITGCKTA